MIRLPKVTDELLETFMRQQELEPTYHACVDDKIPCKSDNPGRHCDDCHECIELTNKLRVLTGATVWEPSGIGADGPEPPRYVVGQHAAAWRRSWKLHLELRTAAAKRRAKAAT